jgi:hypothetical protein
MVLASLLMVMALRYPGDTGFLSDELTLMQMALDANGLHHLASHGLLGTYGIHYGPAPVWFYQAILLCSHHLPTVALIHTAVFFAMTASGLIWLAAALGWWRWFVPIIFAGPYFWFYARLPWDNPLAMPIGILTVAAYASFVSRPAFWKLVAAITGIWLLAGVHLMTMPLVLALILCLLGAQWRVMLRWKWRLGGIVVMIVICSIPYLLVLHQELPGRAPGLTDRMDGLMLCLQAPRMQSAMALGSVVGEQWMQATRGMLQLPIAVTGIAYLLVWGGASACLWGMLRGHREQDGSAQQQVLRLVLLAVALQMLIFTLRGLPRYLHYNNGVWVAHVVLAWWAADLLVRRYRAGRWLLGVYAAALITVTGTLAHQLHAHQNGWPVAQSMEIVRAMTSLPADATVETSLPDGYIRRPDFDVIARMMGLGPIRWAARGEGRYVLRMDGSTTQRFILEPRIADGR